MMNNRGVAITSDITRTISSKPFEPSSSMTCDVFRDTVYKHLAVATKGALQTNYGSGTPVSDDASTIGRLVNFFKIDAGGDFTIKNISPWILHAQAILATGNMDTRLAAAAAAATDANALSANAKFVYGTDTQYTTFNDAVLISFENVLSGEGRMKTMFDTRGLPSCTLETVTAAYSNLQAFGNTAPVTYVASGLQLIVTSIETQNIPLNAGFSYWKQTQKSVPFTAATSTLRTEIVRGNYLQGIMFEVRNGDSGGATTGVGKNFSNSLLTNIDLIVNGTQYIKQTSFNLLQRQNRSQYGLNAFFVGNKSLLDGIAYMDLLTPLSGTKFGSIETAQNLLAPAVDMVEVQLTSDATGPFTSTANVRMVFNEILQPVGKN